MEIILLIIGFLFIIMAGASHSMNARKSEVQNGILGVVYVIASFLLGSDPVTGAIRAILMIYGIFSLGVSFGKIIVKGGESFKKAVDAADAMIKLEKHYYTVHKKELEREKS